MQLNEAKKSFNIAFEDIKNLFNNLEEGDFDGANVNRDLILENLSEVEVFFEEKQSKKKQKKNEVDLNECCANNQ